MLVLKLSERGKETPSPPGNATLLKVCSTFGIVQLHSPDSDEPKFRKFSSWEIGEGQSDY
uniref:Uncharacterized protein n=1 Tax=Anguilla anguilla TaxID=7936 RepID=A0A0E9QQG8_ANGAN